MSTSQLKYYRLWTGFMFALTVLLTWQLWSDDRNFPNAPLFSGHAVLVGTVGLIYKIALLVSIVLFALSVPYSAWVLLFLFIAGVADDMNRLRPDFYQYAAIALFFGLSTLIKQDNLLNSLRIMQGAIYLWTGIQKLSYTFLIKASAFFFESFHLALTHEYERYFIMIIPILEIAVGIWFLIEQRLRLAIVIALILHVIIIVQLIVSGWNWSMIGYNVFLIVGNVMLFGSAVKTEPLINLKGLLPKLSATLFLVLPVLSYVHLWPAYMSSAMYSYRTPYASVLLDKQTEQKLPATAQKIIHRDVTGTYLPFNYWMDAETGCLPNPQFFTFEREFEQFKVKYAASDSVKLMVYYDL